VAEVADRMEKAAAEKARLDVEARLVAKAKTEDRRAAAAEEEETRLVKAERMEAAAKEAAERGAVVAAVARVEAAAKDAAKVRRKLMGASIGWDDAINAAEEKARLDVEARLAAEAEVADRMEKAAAEKAVARAQNAKAATEAAEKVTKKAKQARLAAETEAKKNNYSLSAVAAAGKLAGWVQRMKGTTENMAAAAGRAAAEAAKAGKTMDVIRVEAVAAAKRESGRERYNELIKEINKCIYSTYYLYKRLHNLQTDNNESICKVYKQLHKLQTDNNDLIDNFIIKKYKKDIDDNLDDYEDYGIRIIRNNIIKPLVRGKIKKIDKQAFTKYIETMKEALFQINEKFRMLKTLLSESIEEIETGYQIVNKNKFIEIYTYISNYINNLLNFTYDHNVEKKRAHLNKNHVLLNELFNDCFIVSNDEIIMTAEAAKHNEEIKQINNILITDISNTMVPDKIGYTDWSEQYKSSPMDTFLEIFRTFPTKITMNDFCKIIILVDNDNKNNESSCEKAQSLTREILNSDNQPSPPSASNPNDGSNSNKKTWIAKILKSVGVNGGKKKRKNKTKKRKIKRK